MAEAGFPSLRKSGRRRLVRSIDTAGDTVRPDMTPAQDLPSGATANAWEAPANHG
jgi:hypothetical protein